MKEYMIHTDTAGIEFGVIADSEEEARTTAQDILNLTIVTRVVECQTPVV